MNSVSFGCTIWTSEHSYICLHVSCSSVRKMYTTCMYILFRTTLPCDVMLWGTEDNVTVIPLE